MKFFSVRDGLRNSHLNLIVFFLFVDIIFMLFNVMVLNLFVFDLCNRTTIGRNVEFN